MYFLAPRRQPAETYWVSPFISAATGVDALVPLATAVSALLRQHPQKYNIQDMCKQAVSGRPPQYAPAPLIPLWTPKRLAPPSPQTAT